MRSHHSKSMVDYISFNYSRSHKKFNDIKVDFKVYMKFTHCVSRTGSCEMVKDWNSNQWINDH